MIMIRTFIAPALAIVVMTLSGCSAGWNLIPPTGPASYDPLAYHVWLEAASPGQIAAERNRLEQDDVPGTIDSVQLALMLSHPRTGSAATRQQAISLLEQVETGVAESAANRVAEYRDFAGIWLRMLRARQGETEAREALADSEAQWRELEARNRQLQSQIEALTNIEQQLIEREQSQEQPARQDRQQENQQQQEDESAE